MRQVWLVLLLGICVSAQNGAKRPLTHRDYDSWRTIQTPAISRDGRYIAYALFPQEGDGHLVVFDVKAGKERREDIGALPPPPDNAGRSGTE